MAADLRTQNPHLLLFPFPSLGHIIPILDLARQLLNRGLTITVLVTPKNLHLLEPLLLTDPQSFHSLVLSPSSGDPFITAASVPFQKRLIAIMRGLSELRTPILEWFQNHPSPPTAIVSDFFLGWTKDLASEIGVPRITLSPSGAFAESITDFLWHNLPKKGDSDGDDFPINFEEIPNSPVFPWYQLSSIYRHFDESDPDWVFLRNGMLANSQSCGTVYNTFTELEGVYIEYVKKEVGHDRIWAVGPLLPPTEDSAGATVRGGSSSESAHEVLTWLNSKPENSVVYVCFGSRADMTRKQIEALAAGLECSNVHFVWCIGATPTPHVTDEVNDVLNGYEDRVAERGYVIKGWAPQVAILRHKAIGSFLTHCGWNSVLEGLSSGSVMLTWPTGADQFANAMLLVDQLGVGIRVGEGTQKIPDPAELGRIVAESIDPTRPEKLRAMKLRDAAMNAVKKGGSSEIALNDFVKSLKEVSKKIG